MKIDYTGKLGNMFSDSPEVVGYLTCNQHHYGLEYTGVQVRYANMRLCVNTCQKCAKKYA